MRALRFEGELRLADVPWPEPGEGEALVAVRRAGICATDRAIVSGYAEFRGTLGHELVGVVRACADGQWIGRRVVPSINVGCGRCSACGRGDPRHCAARRVLGIREAEGGFAEAIVVPVANLHAVPEGVADDAAVFAEPLAAALRVLDQVELTAGARATVIGDGKLGLLVAKVLLGTGAHVTVLGRHAHKLALARTWGATVETDAGAGAVVRRSEDVVVEASGSASGLREALERVRPRGSIVLKSTLVRPLELEASRVVVDEIQILGSRCGSIGDALAVLASGSLDPRPLVEARYPLSNALEAFAHANRRGALKVLIDPTQ